MAALEERDWKFELGIDHIRNAFKRANNGFMDACKMLEAERQKNQKLEIENAKLRELTKDLFWYIDRDVWSHTIFDRAHELGIEAADK